MEIYIFIDFYLTLDFILEYPYEDISTSDSLISLVEFVKI